MKKSLVAVALSMACASVSAAEISNGRISGMGGAGYVTSGYSDGVLLNPSLLANYGETDDVALVMNFGVNAQDPDDTLDNLDELVDLTDYLDNKGSLNLEDAIELKRLLKAVDEKTLQVTGGASVAFAIPTEALSVAIIAKGSFAISATPHIGKDDFAVIDTLICAAQDPSSCNTFTPEDDLGAEVTARGVVVQEVGLALAKSFTLNDGSRLLVGLTPKRVEVDTIVYRDSIANFDEDEIDSDEYQTNGSSTSLDAGVTLIQGNLSYGVSVSNLASKEFRTHTGEVYELATQATGAIGYNNDWLRAEVAMDLNAVDMFGFKDQTQMLRVGAEVSPFSWIQFRVGYQTDTKGALADAVTVGFGLSPFDTINLDVAAISGSDDAVGVAMQLGLRF